MHTKTRKSARCRTRSTRPRAARRPPELLLRVFRLSVNMSDLVWTQWRVDACTRRGSEWVRPLNARLHTVRTIGEFRTKWGWGGDTNSGNGGLENDSDDPEHETAQEEAVYKHPFNSDDEHDDDDDVDEHDDEHDVDEHDDDDDVDEHDDDDEDVGSLPGVVRLPSWADVSAEALWKQTDLSRS